MDGVDIGRAIVMLIFTGVNLILIWVNYMDLHSPSYQCGLVVGPPTKTMQMSLFVFSIIASVFSGIEIINTLTVPFNDGRPRLPLELEQCLVLALESVPIAAINLSIVVCRMRNHTPLQTSSCVFLVLNFIVRMVYARAFNQEFKSCGKSFRMCILVMTGLFFFLLLILCGLVWGRVNASFRPLPDVTSNTWLSGVSVMLLNAPELEHNIIYEHDITNLVRKQNIPLNKPWLVKNLWDIKDHNEAGIVSIYACQTNHKDQIVPAECEGYDELKFHFKYNHDWEWSPSKPLGMISYNFAQVGSNGAVCIQANSTLAGNWKLFYYSIKVNPRTNWTVAILVSSPWKEACTVPFSVYDSNIEVCS